MPLRLSDNARNAHADGVVDLIDAGAGAGYIEIRTGTQPATPATAASGTLLATIPLNDPAFGAAAAGVATLDNTPVPEDTSADATGTAGWCRVYDSNNAVVFDGDVTATSGGGVIELVSTSITAGQAVQITSGTYTAPMA